MAFYAGMSTEFSQRDPAMCRMSRARFSQISAPITIKNVCRSLGSCAA